MSASRCLILILVLSLLLSLMGQPNSIVSPRPLWCVAKNNADDQSLQQAIDWACGPGGANCSPIQQGGSCYYPNDVQTSASWAFNDYYLKHGLTDDACVFGNTAALTSLNPSRDSCKFPSSLSVDNGNISGSTPTPIIEMGPDSADLSGCDQIAGTWFWTILTSNLFVILVMMVTGV